MHKIQCTEIEPFTSGYKRLNVLLDLDNTIINSLSMPYELKRVSQEYQDKIKYHDMEGQYRIFERPYLQVFLDYLFANYDVSIFTAADKEYALFIYDNIIKKPDPQRKIHYLFSGYHSDISEILYDSPKDLKLLWDQFNIANFKPCNTIIVDDLYDVYCANPDNCVRAPKFEILNNKKVNLKSHMDVFLISKAIRDIERHHKNLINNPCINHVDNNKSITKCERIKLN